MFSPTVPNCFSIQQPPNIWTLRFLNGTARPVLRMPVQEATKEAKQFICCHTAKMEDRNPQWPNSPTSFAVFTPPCLPLTKINPMKTAKLLPASFSPLLLQHLLQEASSLSAAPTAAVHAGVRLRVLERAHGTPCCPRWGGLTHLPSKAFDFIQAEKPLGSSVLPQLLPKSLQACGTWGKEMHFNPP